MVIAIDGPAGSGKSTVARNLARRLDFVFLNSGSFYRGITLSLLQAGFVELKAGKASFCRSEAEILTFAQALSLDYRNERLFINGEDAEDRLRTDSIDACASSVAALAGIRSLVNASLRRIPREPGLVCEGRDMTTLVFPDAEHKFYLDARIEVQAERRFRQGLSSLSLAEIRQAIEERDVRDRNRPVGALTRAVDAVYIDTSDLTIEQVCEIIVRKLHV